MATNRRSILQMLPLGVAGFIAGTAAINARSVESTSLPVRREYGGSSLNGWEIAVGDALYNREDEAIVSLNDMETAHHVSSNERSYSELLVNVNRRIIMAHNISLYRVVDDAALGYVHNCGYKFYLPYSPLPDSNAEYNGQTVEGGIFVWDGSTTKLDYGMAFQWIVNPWDKSGYLNIWTGTQWEKVGELDLTSESQKWHEVKMTVDCQKQATTLLIDEKLYPSRFTTTQKSNFGAEIAARLQAEIVSIYPEPSGLRTAHKAQFKDWYWIWEPPKVHLPIIFNEPTLTPTPTFIPTSTPTATATPRPTPASCEEAYFIKPEPNQTVSRPFEVCWIPSTCEMVLQAYQNEELVYDKRVKSCTRLDVNDIQQSGLTELKIWKPDASSPRPSIWVTIT